MDPEEGIWEKHYNTHPPPPLFDISIEAVLWLCRRCWMTTLSLCEYEDKGGKMMILMQHKIQWNENVFGFKKS